MMALRLSTRASAHLHWCALALTKSDLLSHYRKTKCQNENNWKWKSFPNRMFAIMRKDGIYGIYPQSIL